MTFGEPFYAASDAGAISAAVTWIQATMLGQVATVVATLAVSAIGLGLLYGHIDLRRGFFAVIGCFVLFGASSIASGLIAASEFASVSKISAAPSTEPMRPAEQIARVPTANDPYAGAAMPVQ